MASDSGVKNAIEATEMSERITAYSVSVWPPGGHSGSQELDHAIPALKGGADRDGWQWADWLILRSFA